MNRHFFLRRTFARLMLRLVRWQTVGHAPPRGILVGAPHTSNWDWALTILLAWDNSVQLRLLIKQDFFKGPLGSLMRATGGVPLDRKNPGGTIRQMLAESHDEAFLLGIAAEGTRSKGEYWKSGFYRISQQTGIPITLAFVDGPSRRVGFGPTFSPTGDIRADMDLIREFYADKTGLRPENATLPRLREEERSD